MSLPNPNMPTWENWMESCVLIGNLVTAIHGRKELKTGDHTMILREGRGYIRCRHVQDVQTALVKVMAAAPALYACHLQWGTKTGVWLTVFPYTVNRTDMGYQECYNALFLRYGIDPPYLPPTCDVYNDKFSIYHALDCKKGGLIMTHHNELRDGVAYLSGK